MRSSECRDQRSEWGALRCLRLGLFTAVAACVLALPSSATEPKKFLSQVEEQSVEPVVIEAQVIESNKMDDGSVRVHAYGEVLFQQGNKRLTGDEFFYNGAINTGILKNATFTTCNKPNPDYRVSANEITLTSDQRLILKRARIYLGNFKLLSLPKLSVNLSQSNEDRSIMPRPGYSGRDGLFVASDLPIVSTNEDELALGLRLSVRRGILGGFTGGHAWSGDAMTISPYVPDWRMELRRTSIVQPRRYGDSPSNVEFQGQAPSPSLGAWFGALQSRQPTPDVDEEGILVSRLPELGVRIVSHQAAIDRPEVGLQGQLRASWGRFEESPDSVGVINRWDARGIGSTTLAKLDRNTVLRASGTARYSIYDTGDRYRVLGGSLDVSRILEGGSFASLRLINHWIGGSTPFEFDDVDIKREVQAAGRYVRGRNAYGIVLDYDLGKDELRSWQFTYSRRLDCLEPSITFNSDLAQVSIGVRVLGL